MQAVRTALTGVGLIVLAVVPFLVDTAAGQPVIDNPIVTTQPLPPVQRTLRVSSVSAVRPDLVAAATASSLAYTGAERAPGWRQYTIKRAANLFGADNTVIVLKKDPARKSIELAVRGTATLDDALKDINTRAIEDGFLQVPLHSGFRQIALGVKRFLDTNLTSEEANQFSYRFYGHSLGGAVASIVAMYLHQSGKTVEMVGTFGAPRFTTNAGARKYQVLNDRTFRVVRCDDVVPFLPPPNFSGWSNNNYEASGNLFLMLKPPDFDFSKGIDIERDFMHQLRSELNNASSREKLAFGHRMNNYEDLLRKFTPGGLLNGNDADELQPVSYQLSMQSEFCPARLVDSR